MKNSENPTTIYKPSNSIHAKLREVLKQQEIDYLQAFRYQTQLTFTEIRHLKTEFEEPEKRKVGLKGRETRKSSRVVS